MEIRFDRYYTNEELQSVLNDLAETYPDLVEASTLGKSYEGRDIPLMVLTQKKTGPHKEKPAFWIDGNLHATEMVGCMAAVYFLHKMVSRYGKDPRVTRILDEYAVYVAPRLNPDGAAMALDKIPKYIRCSPRHYPHGERLSGLHVEDVDQDGRILQMRIKDPNGDWKISEKDPRLMIKRGANEEGGTYYRLFPEGSIQNYDGYTVYLAPSLHGMDFNRNFPWCWRPEGQQSGAGEYPTSTPEVRAIVDFITQCTNICGAITYHSFSGALLRPLSHKSDNDMDTEDLWTYQNIGEIGTKITGYPCVSTFHDFKYHPKEVITGTFDDWMYEHKGAFTLTIELWDLPTASGVKEKNEKKNFIDWFRKHPFEDDYKIVDFIDKHMPEGLVPWYEFQHPQLGKVELGGWNRIFTWRNPPPSLLEKEIAPQADFAIEFISLLPRLTWHTIKVEKVGEDAYHILTVLENKGYFPTYVCNQAKNVRTIKPVRMEIELPEGATLYENLRRQEIGHLEGRANKHSMSYLSSSPTDNRAKAQWLIKAPQGGRVKISAISQRAGMIHHEFALEEVSQGTPLIYKP